jgi:hypothetical protein
VRGHGRIVRNYAMPSFCKLRRRRIIRIILTVLTLIFVCGAATESAQASLTPKQREAKRIIREEFPRKYRQAQRVAYCESRYHRKAQNGQYRGLFQLSASWRRYFHALGMHNVGFNARQNAHAAHLIYRGNGKSWYGQWSCAYAAQNGPR